MQFQNTSLNRNFAEKKLWWPYGAMPRSDSLFLFKAGQNHNSWLWVISQHEIDIMHKKVKKKQPALLNRHDAILLHDNARSHKASLTVDKLTSLRYEILSHTPHPQPRISHLQIITCLAIMSYFYDWKNIITITIS